MIRDNFWMIIIIAITLYTLYFIIKHAIKNGVKEAYHEIQKEKSDSTTLYCDPNETNSDSTNQ